MHELSIAVALMEQVIKAAQDSAMARVSRVEIETGALRQVIPEIMQTAFKEASRATFAEGAELVIIETSAKARCRRCDSRFEPEADNFLCPGCAVADVEVLQGDAIILKSVSGEKG